MKKLILTFALALSAVSYPAHADNVKTLAIIDSGVDINHPSIKNNISYEVCISSYNSCPNKTNFQEGPGAATLTPAMYSNSQWGHGTEVASAATQADPNVKIIEIRCASLLFSNGYLGCNYDMFALALNWVANNASKFNIGAVVAPLGIDVPIGGNAPVSCSTSYSFVPAINNLIAMKMPVIVPVGNDFNYNAINNPACLTGVLAISSIDDKGRLALYANYSPRIDFAAPGNLTVATPGGFYKSDTGTSLSVGVFGADWVKLENVKKLSYIDEYNLIKKTSDPYTNIMVKQNVLDINMVKALQ